MSFKKPIIFLAVILVSFLIVDLFIKKDSVEVEKLIPMSIAMDYTPNTNHTGIYVALQKGWYKEEGINLSMLPYSANVSPELLVTTDKADVGIGSTESVVSSAVSGYPVVSIATIIKHNTSSLVARADSGIKRPKDLSGKIYGGYGAPYEDAVVGAIIAKDGGKKNFKNVTLDLEQLQALLTKRIDFAWIFDGWTGLEAKRGGLELVSFPINSNGIADYYTPVFIASPNEIKNKNILLKKFMNATKKGYEYAILNPDESAKILIALAPKGTFPDEDFVFESQKYLSAHYSDKNEKWGIQDAKSWHDYPKFMLDSLAMKDINGNIVKQLDFNSLYTNQFIE